MAKLLAKNPAARYPTADDLRVDLRRFRDGQRPEALAQAAAAAGVGGAAAAARPTTVTRRAVGLRPAHHRRRRIARHPGPPAAARRGRRRHHPRRRYDEPRRTGWLWAGIVLALLVLGVGGFLLYKALKDDDPARPSTHRHARRHEQAARRRHEGAQGPGLRGQDHADAAGERRRRREHRLRAGPGRGTEVPTDGKITLTYNPAKAPFTLRQLRRLADRRRQGRARPGQGAVQVTEVESDRPVGEVLAQDPPPGQVGRQHGRQAHRVEGPRPKVAIPNVANIDVGDGDQRSSARLGLVTTRAERGQRHRRRRHRHPHRPAGRHPGRQGPTVVARRLERARPRSQVPNVVGLQRVRGPRRRCRAPTSSRRSVQVDVPFGSPQANVVIDQTPAAGEPRPPAGSTVTIRIGKPGAPTTTSPRRRRAAETAPPDQRPSRLTAPVGSAVSAPSAAPRKLAAGRGRRGQDRLRVELHALDGSSRWRRPMIVPSAVSAVISKQSGSDSRSTTSEW